jgi:hypothetical protein
VGRAGLCGLKPVFSEDLTPPPVGAVVSQEVIDYGVDWVNGALMDIGRLDGTTLGLVPSFAVLWQSGDNDYDPTVVG